MIDLSGMLHQGGSSRSLIAHACMATLTERRTSHMRAAREDY